MRVLTDEDDAEVNHDQTRAQATIDGTRGVTVIVDGDPDGPESGDSDDNTSCSAVHTVKVSKAADVIASLQSMKTQKRAASAGGKAPTEAGVDERADVVMVEVALPVLPAIALHVKCGNIGHSDSRTRDCPYNAHYNGKFGGEPCACRKCLAASGRKGPGGSTRRAGKPPGTRQKK